MSEMSDDGRTNGDLKFFTDRTDDNKMSEELKIQQLNTDGGFSLLNNMKADATAYLDVVNINNKLIILCVKGLNGLVIVERTKYLKMRREGKNIISKINNTNCNIVFLECCEIKIPYWIFKSIEGKKEDIFKRFIKVNFKISMYSIKNPDKISPDTFLNKNSNFVEKYDVCNRQMFLRKIWQRMGKKLSKNLFRLKICNSRVHEFEDGNNRPAWEDICNSSSARQEARNSISAQQEAHNSISAQQEAHNSISAQQEECEYPPIKWRIYLSVLIFCLAVLYFLFSSIRSIT
jgi:hypothetical protein